MQQYHFGGSRLKKLTGHFINFIARSSNGTAWLFVRIAKWINFSTVQLRIRANQLSAESEPITIHIARIVPLDKWTLRIEFTVNRKIKYCMHHNSPIGGYAGIFANFKRKMDIEIIDAHYYMVAAAQKEWKQV